MTPHYGDPHEAAALRSLHRLTVVPGRPRRESPPPEPPDLEPSVEPDPVPAGHAPGVIDIEHRRNGEIVWRCELPHGPSRRSAHGNRWDDDAGVLAAVRRHLGVHHPDLDIDDEIARVTYRDPNTAAPGA